MPELARGIDRLGYIRVLGEWRETEYLLLLRRYVHQARDLEELAGPGGVILVNHCADAGPLLRVLGYRLTKPCGQKDTSLAPDGPENAFLTLDSGFPLTRLEEALRSDAQFSYPFSPSRVPALLKPSDWTNASLARGVRKGDLLEVLLRDPKLADLYWAFSRLDSQTADVLQRSVGLSNLLPYARVLEYYGTEICVRSGRVLVPGGAAAESAWRELVGVSPASPGQFILALLKQDRGWMALYFDTLARVSKAQQAHLTQGSRLRASYKTFLDPGTKLPAAEAAFRKDPGLLLLFTRQQWLADGQPRIPGSVDLWRPLLGKAGRRVSSPEQVFEAMVAASRADDDAGPLQVYLSLNELEMARRSRKSVSPSTLRLMADSYAQFSSWYPIFNEFPELDEESIVRFLEVAKSIDRISNSELRGNALGILQANISLWQILARQGEIPTERLEPSWQAVVGPFSRMGSPEQLLAAGETSLGELMLAASGRRNLSQDEFIDLLAGPVQKGAEGKRIREEIADKMRSVMEDQRLTSLDTLLELGRELTALSHGEGDREKTRLLAAELRQFEMPRRIFSESEKTEWAPGTLREEHAQTELHTDLRKILEPAASSKKIENARGQLPPFLRDTLVGLVYAYYEPIGSELLHINPLLVRSHDFSASSVVGVEHVWQPSTLFGTGVSAGGGAYLVGSLANLPYVLAAAEQNFIAPKNVQALIWEELAPSLLATATIARWWNVSPRELHAVALYQESGEELLSRSADDPHLRDQVMAILSERMPPQRIEQIRLFLQAEDRAGAISRMLPADTFFLALEYREQFPQDGASLGPASQALAKLERQEPVDVRPEKISRDFGIPHPVLTQTYRRELVSSQPFPAFAGRCDGLLGESWDSNNLYWARIADKMNDSPAALNLLSPRLTRSMISKIFATDLEDWSALARAMHEAGEEFLHERAASLPGTEANAER